MHKKIIEIGTLKDVANIIMGQSPTGTSCNIEKNGIPLLNGPTEFGSHHPTPVQYTTDPKKIANKNDLLFCVRGSTTGRMNWADQQYAIGRGVASLSEIKEKTRGYIKGLIDYHLPQILKIATGSTFPNVSKEMLEKLVVTIPPLPEQRAIADILSSLDDKIELNNRMNKTLEQMARAIFKSWFVDFEPVHAKMEGRDSGLPKEIDDLFPAEFEESILGDIPKGWEVGPLDSVLVLQRGFDLPSLKRTSGAYPVLAASGPSGKHNEFKVRGPGVTTGRSGVLGKVFYVHDDFWPLNTSLWVKEFRRSMPAYAYHILAGLDLTLYNSGSAVPTLNRNHVHNLPTLLPPMELITAFERLASTNLNFQKHNNDQSITLSLLRDTLLPKLMSGELRVPPEKVREYEDV